MILSENIWNNTSICVLELKINRIIPITPTKVKPAPHDRLVSLRLGIIQLFSYFGISIIWVYFGAK